MASLTFDNVFIADYFTIAGPQEKLGQIRQFDLKMNDYYFGEKTFEKAEIKMQKVVIDNLLYRNRLLPKDLDCIISGDLTDQIAVSNYAVRNYDTSYLGLYNACASFPEGLIIASSLMSHNALKQILVMTSSHNLTAEKQFRYPVEYGAPRKKTTTFTATGACGALLSKAKARLKIEAATIGRVIDLNIKDVNHLGAVMAPAAAEVLHNHLQDFKRSPNYYDVIVTGDLGAIGARIFEDYLLINYNLKLKKHLDAGEEIFVKSQNVKAGASGPISLPMVFFNKIILNNKYRRILLIGTGALHSPSLVNQKESIPAIAHAVSLEVLK